MSLKFSPNFFLDVSEHEMIGESTTSYRFESFRLDVKERQLLHDDSLIPLTPKAFDVLVVLVQNSGHLVEKNELLEQVWEGSFVEEGNVARIVHTLRRALGEDENRNKFIETVATKGYRFVAEVTEERENVERHLDNLERLTPADKKFADTLEVNGPAKPAAPFEPESAVGQKRPNRVVFFVVGFATAISLILLVSFNFFPGAGANSAKTKSIAILPAKPLIAGNYEPIYEFGIADSLIYKIAASKNLTVRALSATRKYSLVDQDALSAGREQQVDYVLASNYQLADGKIRLTAQLFNVANGQIEETYKSEKDVGDLFRMQDAIADEIGNVLLARFGKPASAPAAKRGTQNEEAYRLYLQGIFGRLEEREAIQKFEEAIQLDPNYAQSWVGLALMHRRIGNRKRDTNRPEEYQKSMEAINNALALDPTSGDAHSMLCENKLLYEYDFDGAGRECKLAIELDPNSSLAHQTYARYLSSQGRHDEAVAEGIAAIDLDPASLWSQHSYGFALHFARRYTESIAQFKRMIIMDEDFGLSYMTLVADLADSGNEAEAFEWWKQLMVKWKFDEDTVREYTSAFQREGWLGVTRVNEKYFTEGNQVYFHGGAMNAQLGNNEKAFDYLEQSFAGREIWIAFLKVDPRLDKIRDDPRFSDLVARVGLK